LDQLGLQFASHALPWSVFALFAFRTAFRDAGRRRDIRCWYLVASTLWMISAARLGAGYPYFIDWQLAVMLWIGVLVSDWLAGNEPSSRRLASVATVALMAQIVVADLVVASVLAYDLATTKHTADAMPSLCRYVPVAPALTPSESPGLVRACGGRPALDPFIIANLTTRGLWNETPFIRDLSAGRYPAIIVPFDPRAEVDGAQRERWTPGVLAAMARSYQTTVQIGGWRVLSPIPRR
jgi:hypothetical protein